MITSADDNTYTCTATNTAGSSSASFRLSVECKLAHTVLLKVALPFLSSAVYHNYTI